MGSIPRAGFFGVLILLLDPWQSANVAQAQNQDPES